MKKTVPREMLINYIIRNITYKKTHLWQKKALNRYTEYLNTFDKKRGKKAKEIQDPIFSRFISLNYMTDATPALSPGAKRSNIFFSGIR